MTTPRGNPGPGTAIFVLPFMVTLSFGFLLRWQLTGLFFRSLPFLELRHAHAHLGYYGLLFPLSWLAWKAAGVKTFSPKWMVVYAIATWASVFGFLQGGYAPLSRSASGVVALFWLVSAFWVIPRMKQLKDPLGAVPLGVLLSLSMLPVVALSVSRFPELTAGLVSSFLAALLLLVILPSTLASRQLSVGPWPLLLILGGLSAAALGAYPRLWTQAGLVGYALLLLLPKTGPFRSQDLGWLLRTVWGLVALGLLAMGTGLLPNVQPVAIGAIHFLILGPVLHSLAPRVLRRMPSTGMWIFGHLSWGMMSLALVTQAFGVGLPASHSAALGGSLTVLFWLHTWIREFIFRYKSRKTQEST